MIWIYVFKSTVSDLVTGPKDRSLMSFTLCSLSSSGYFFCEIERNWQTIRTNPVFAGLVCVQGCLPLTTLARSWTLWSLPYPEDRFEGGDIYAHSIRSLNAQGLRCNALGIMELSYYLRMESALKCDFAIVPFVPFGPKAQYRERRLLIFET